MTATAGKFSAATYGFTPGQVWTVSTNKDSMRQSSHVVREITECVGQIISYSYAAASGAKGEASTHISNFITWITVHKCKSKTPVGMSVTRYDVPGNPAADYKEAITLTTTALKNAALEPFPYKDDYSHIQTGQVWRRTKVTSSGRTHKHAHIERNVLSVTENRVTFRFTTAEGKTGTTVTHVSSFASWLKMYDAEIIFASNPPIEVTVARAEAPAVQINTNATVFKVNGVKVVAHSLIGSATKYLEYNPGATSLHVEATDEQVIV